MKYFIISDIHGNFEALKEVTNQIKDESLIVLGDIIGYGPFPNECINEVLKYKPVVIRGNHEDYLNGKLIEKYNKNARVSHEILDGLLDEKTMDKLKNLPFTKVIDNFLITHGSPFKPESFYYIRENDLKAPSLQLSFILIKNMNINLALIGHTHRPGIFVENRRKEIEYINIEFDKEYNLLDDHRYIINCGSVGQPRNLIKDAQYVIYDSNKKSVIFKKQEYDVNKTIEGMKKLNLPDDLSLRLLLGQ